MVKAIEYLCNPDKLIVVVMAMEERLFPVWETIMHEATNKNVLTKAVLAPENHGRQHTTKAPHVKAVVIHLVVDQQLWTLRRNSG